MMADSLNTDKFLDNDTSECWLTLATKASIADSVAIQLADGASATTETLVDKLLETISHELKSPLTGIVGLSSLFKDQQLGKLNQRQLRYAQLIYHGGQKLMSIVNDLIELTSFTVEKFQPQPEAIDLRFFCLQLFQQAMSKYKLASAAESNFFLETQLKLDIEPGAEKAIADKVQLSTILSHLILETLQFCEPVRNILTIEVKSWQECTAIIVSNGLMSDFELASSTDNFDNFGYPQQSSGLNLVIAQYLAQIAQVKIQSDYSTDGCQLTLLLPQAKTEMSNYCSDNLAFNTQDKVKKNLTVLCLYPEPEMVDPIINSDNGLNFNLKNWAEQDWTNISQQHHYQHRIIEADGLEQAHTLARIWKLDVIVLDGHQIADPIQYWRSLQASEYLTALPIVTLDTRTTEAANQIEGLKVYPCLLRADCRSIKDLMQVIQIATGLEQFSSSYEE
ncbi:sensor histidine kinase [Pleurocapsa sp. FMAR1]|uniref:sensor histidine kinase n=1 Tax=Pleurocapsa sp. FMAR1 TaxID=3040204 RepID=UPI0029C6801D|nr:histidine kinase dimerization/phospho-acceptor domain-containing protein [Pleurocapsa sp. FMAR1]